MFDIISSTPINQPTPEDPTFPLPIDPQQTPQLPENNVLLETQRGDFDGNGVEDVREIYSNGCEITHYYREEQNPDAFAPVRTFWFTVSNCQ